MKIINRPIIAIALILSSQSVLAHGEGDKARFVSEAGEDAGSCDNRFRPCQSILYALKQANKGDEILVAAGNYTLSSPQELLYLTNDINPVRGGYSTLDNFQFQKPQTHLTTISAVPLKETLVLEKQGFHVIVDAKSDEFTQSYEQLQKLLSITAKSQSASACENGRAAGYECDKVSLVSHVSLTSFGQISASDVWGHYDLNTQTEYALVGLRTGIAVVSLANPESPDIVGVIEGQSTAWRDIKVYQHYNHNQRRWVAYAYATADRVTEGLTIIDLNDLPESVSLVKRTNDDVAAHNVYISNVDHSLNIPDQSIPAQLHTLGQPSLGGAMRSFLLNDPETPVASYIPENANRNDYTHDASSMTILDERATSQCINSVNGACTVMLDFNENEMRLWDHSASNSAVMLSASTYPQASYVHSGWWSEDQQYVFVHDEKDEQDLNMLSTLYVFDVSDLSSPILAGQWSGTTNAIDHNGYVRGNRYYMSNYERGLNILDITDPTAPEQVGLFDTFPSSNSNTFNGAWGVYPYLPSGLILISDMNSGLYVLKDETRNNHIGFAQTQLTVEEGDNIQLMVNNTFSAETSVDYRIFGGSATADDVELTSGTLSWSAGDTDAKAIALNINGDDQNAEIDEVFFIKLYNPRNGATLSNDNMATVTIKGVEDRGVVGFSVNSIVALENQGTVTIEVDRNGGSGGQVVVDYQLMDGTGTANLDASNISGSLTWNDGETQTQSIEITLVDDQESETTETLLLQLSSQSENVLNSNTVVEISIRDDESNLPPEVYAGEDQEREQVETIFLNGSGEDPEGDTLTFLWQQTAGPTVEINDPTRKTTHFVAPAETTTLTFTLTATDDFGTTATDDITFSIVAPPPSSLPTAPEAPNSGGGSTGLLWLSLLALLVPIRRFAVKIGN